MNTFYNLYNFIFGHKLVAEFLLATVGAFIAWKFWRFLDVKSIVIFYALRTVWIIGGYSLFPNLISHDLPGWYMHACWMVDDGLVPGKDFLSPYNIGFNALLWLAVKIWHSPFSIAIMFALFECVAIILLFKMLNETFKEKIAARSVMLYISSPLCYVCAQGAQDEPMILLGVVIALYFYLKRFHIATVISLVVTFLCTKFIAPIYFYPFVLMFGASAVITLMLSICAMYGILAVLGLKPFMTHFGRYVGMETYADQCSQMQTNGNIWAVLPSTPSAVKYIIGIAIICVVALMFVRYFTTKKERDAIMVRYALTVSLMIVELMYLFFPACWPSYVLPVMPFAFVWALGQGVCMRKIFTLLFVSLWGWLVYYCGSSQPWLPACFAVSFCVLYYTVHLSFIVLLLISLRPLIHNPIVGVDAILSYIGLMRKNTRSL